MHVRALLSEARRLKDRAETILDGTLLILNFLEDGETE
jgi:hypothetical protein